MFDYLNVKCSINITWLFNIRHWFLQLFCLCFENNQHEKQDKGLWAPPVSFNQLDTFI